MNPVFAWVLAETTARTTLEMLLILAPAAAADALIKLTPRWQGALSERRYRGGGNVSLDGK